MGIRCVGERETRVVVTVMLDEWCARDTSTDLRCAHRLID
jgi:hypothetical protein